MELKQLFCSSNIFIPKVDHSVLNKKKEVRTCRLGRKKPMNPRRNLSPTYSFHQSLYMKLFHQLFLKKDEKQIYPRKAMEVALKVTGDENKQTSEENPHIFSFPIP